MALTYDQIREQVHAGLLDGINRYNPQNIELLEEYVNAQCRENKYDLEANLTVLKLYQLNSDKYNADIVAKVLLKCLTQLPKTDIVLAKCLIDQAKMNQSPVSDILELADLLETCHFPLVWDMLATKADIIPKVAGLEDAFRNFVCHVISIAYQHIEKGLLMQLLGSVSEDKLKAYCQQCKWELKPDGFVFICNQEATVKSRNIAEKIDLKNIQDILRAASNA